MSFSSIMRFMVDLLMPTVGSNTPSAKRRSSSTLRSSFWAFAVILTILCGSLTADDKFTVALLGGDAVAGWRSNGREAWKKNFSSIGLKTVNLAMPGEMPEQTLQRLSDGILDSVKPRMLNYMAKNGYRHHVAFVRGNWSAAIVEAFSNYLGYEVDRI